jgi:hypothetical protein
LPFVKNEEKNSSYIQQSSEQLQKFRTYPANSLFLLSFLALAEAAVFWRSPLKSSKLEAQTAKT